MVELAMPDVAMVQESVREIFAVLQRHNLQHPAHALMITVHAVLGIAVEHGYTEDQVTQMVKVGFEMHRELGDTGI